MARNRTPTSILEANGAFDRNPDRGRARENEPIPSGPLGDPPERLTRVQREVWIELSQEIPDGVLSVADRKLLEIYCRFEAFARGGDPDESGAAMPPQKLKASEYNLMVSILSRMGMTPADRSKLNVPSPEKEKATNTFEELASTGRGRGFPTRQ
jgi:phage terminase small subunit